MPLVTATSMSPDPVSSVFTRMSMRNRSSGALCLSRDILLRSLRGVLPVLVRKTRTHQHGAYRINPGCMSFSPLNPTGEGAPRFDMSLRLLRVREPDGRIASILSGGETGESATAVAASPCHPPDPNRTTEESSMNVEEAVTRINESVTVEMLVQRTKCCTGSRQVFLDSEPNHRDPKNLGVVVTDSARAKFAEVGIEDPTTHFKGKTIRVRGVVIRREGCPYIEVDDPGQVELVT